MTEDPRHRHLTFAGRTVADYLEAYADAVHAGLVGMDTAALERARAALCAATKAGRRVYSIGNGGSSAIADHLCCDFTKGTSHHACPPIRTQSLSANVPLYSALANDHAFAEVFSRQIDFYCDAGDVLVAISSSGASPNILNAVTAAQAKGVTVIGLSGFSGGELSRTADVSLHVDAFNYGVVEDCHQSLMHVLAQFIAKERDEERP